VPLAGFLIVRGTDRNMVRSFGWQSSVAVLSLVVAGYYVVYLATPIPLDYQLATSLDRLIIQLWPSLLLILGLMSSTLKAPILQENLQC
jgi:hypothetical protein